MNGKRWDVGEAHFAAVYIELLWIISDSLIKCDGEIGSFIGTQEHLKRSFYWYFPAEHEIV